MQIMQIIDISFLNFIFTSYLARTSSLQGSENSQAAF